MSWISDLWDVFSEFTVPGLNISVTSVIIAIMIMIGLSYFIKGNK